MCFFLGGGGGGGGGVMSKTIFLDMAEVFVVLYDATCCKIKLVYLKSLLS